jgi:hypothetical protein
MAQTIPKKKNSAKLPDAERHSIFSVRMRKGFDIPPPVALSSLRFFWYIKSRLLVQKNTF